MTYLIYVLVDEDLIVAEYPTDEDVVNTMKYKIDLMIVMRSKYPYHCHSYVKLQLTFIHSDL